MSEQGATASEAAEVNEAAASAVADFARFQDVFQFDLADSPAISQLESDPKYGLLHQLLGIMLQGNVKVCPAPAMTSPTLSFSICCVVAMHLSTQLLDLQSAVHACHCITGVVSHEMSLSSDLDPLRSCRPCKSG